MSCIRARGLTKSYDGTAAVKDLDLTVEPGMVFGFLGPNGAGKSTTIKILTTLIQPDRGELSILGIDALEHPLEVRKRIGVVLQQPSYEPTLTVERALEKYGMMWGVRDGRRERVERLIEDFGLAGIRHRKNDDLSIGQRRRVQVAREFMHDVDLLFLDEPTAGLDPAARRSLLDYLRQRAEGGMTVFYTTHVLTEAEYVCDQIAIINRGGIVAVDAPDELKSRFGREKTIKIHVSSTDAKISDLLAGTEGCMIELGSGTDVTIRSDDPCVLSRVLRVLEENNLEVEDLSAIPTSLEEIFLRMVEEP